jgi:hypothetical protein
MEPTVAMEMFASGTQEESMRSLAAATTARGAVRFEWFSEAGHGVIGDDDSPLISASANFFRKSSPISTNRPRTADVAALPNLRSGLSYRGTERRAIPYDSFMRGAGGDVDMVYKTPCELSFAAPRSFTGGSQAVLRSVQNLCHSAKSLMLSKKSSD